MSDPIPFERTPMPGGRARKLLMRRLIDYIAMPGTQIAPQDRSMGGDILLDMLFHATDDERKLCSRRLAEMRGAPRRVLRYLAQCSLEVAKPILEHNEAFDGSDLLEIIDQVSVDHRMVIAGRKRLSPAVCDRLARVGELHVLKTLLSNRGGRIVRDRR